jgi:tyrosine aminotransferase
METLVNSKTKALVVINPSNPCGSVYSRSHLSQLLAFAARHRLPVIADEVYDRMTFGDPYVSMGEIETEVPVFVLGGLAKRWLVPGWRVGWGVVFDRADIAQEARLGIFKVKNMTLHPATFLCNAIPRILETVPEGFYHQIMQKLKSNADFLYNRISKLPCLTMNRPQGAMYALISLHLSQFRDIRTSQEFAEKLAWEQGVIVMPGECFLSEGSFRIVLCNPKGVLAESCDRIGAFIQEHMEKEAVREEGRVIEPVSSPL